MKFVTKPCEIEAIQWTDNTTEILEFCEEHASYDVNDAAWQVGKGAPVEYLTIHTLEGDVQAQRNDFIIKGTHGEFYPCKPDIFMTKYEPDPKYLKPTIYNFDTYDIKYFIIDGNADKLKEFISKTFNKINQTVLNNTIDYDKISQYKECLGLLIYLPECEVNCMRIQESYLLIDKKEYAFFNNILYLSDNVFQNGWISYYHIQHLYGDKVDDKKLV